MSELGEITRCWTITFERRSKHPVEQVWRTITDPERVSTWMRYPARIDLRVGGDWFVDFGDKGELDGVIVRVESERRLRYAWGISMLEWELEADGAGTRYRFMHHGQTPGTTTPEEGLAAGWHAFLESLAVHLEGGSYGASDDQAVIDEVTPAYRERLEALLG
jgi:uncharacterized protein YndB with AHSA1/START domain